MATQMSRSHVGQSSGTASTRRLSQKSVPRLGAFRSVRGSRRALAVSAALPHQGLNVRPALSVDNIRDFDGGFGSEKRKRAAAEAAAAPPTSAPAYESLLAELSPEEARTVRLFRENSPSVVNVNTSVNISTPFNPFNVQALPRGVGSGFIWDTKGHVITNAHVVAGGPGNMKTSVQLTLSDGAVVKAKVIGSDREKDIAVLQIQGMSENDLHALRPVELGSSSNLLVGQKVYAIGNPFGLDQTLTQGIVSGLGREVGTPRMMGPAITNAIQTDAAINPGNSGGPLLDSQGRVVGINTAILDPTGVGISSGVGFAIPIDAVKGMVDQILRVGRIVRPALGITIAVLPSQMMQQLGVDVSAGGSGGVLVAQVRQGGPADVAGVQGTRRELFGPLRLGDVITAINGKPVRKQSDLFSALDAQRVGDSVEVTLFSPATRNTRTVRIVLADREKLAWSSE